MRVHDPDSGTVIDRFHPLVRDWFRQRFGAPTPPQAAGWKEIARGRDTLIAAPTGSGKTLAAFLWSINRLIALAEPSQDHTHVVYVSPLKALGNDIQKNLQEPLAEITRAGRRQGLPLHDIRTAVRSGDTAAAERQRMISRPPHILITTPESLYILLTAERSRQMLKRAQTVIVDEIHAVAGDKRGAHLALSLERLDSLAGRRLQRIGLSATQKPMQDIACLLVGTRRLRRDGAPRCAIVDVGHKRELELAIEVPDQELGAITTHALWADVYDRIVRQIRTHRTTLVFVHTRRLVERVAHQLTDRLGEGKVLAHHGSLSRTTRLEAEQKLKAAEVPVVVATASLELGIDIGHVELVCHIGAPRSIATLLQRVGRSGHWLGAVPKGILYPLTRDDLLQCAAAVHAVRQGELDRVRLVRQPLDVLAQQMVATVASLTPARKPGETLPLLPAGTTAPPPGIAEDDLRELMRGAYPFRNLSRRDFDQVLEMLCEGVASARGRRGAHLHRDRVNGMLRARRGARLVAITNGGAIPDTADYDVVESPTETFVGKVHEDFAIESLAGDIFLLGNTSWRIQRVAAGKVWVQDAHGAPPTIPFWLGESPGRTLELSRAVSDVRENVARRAAGGEAPEEWLRSEAGVGPEGAGQIVAYVNETRAALRCVPTVDRVVAERFFDESGGMQLVLHTPFGGRINRAWGLALRKRFCVNFDFELQAAATDDGIVISLTDRHSFPLDTVFSYLHPATLERDLTQASLAAPMFTNRWRWNASRALALERFSRGRKVPMQIQRMRAEDLLGAVFPEQVMCQDNRSGPVELPDHPLTRETMENCLREAMDVDGLKETLARLAQGEIATVTVETPAPSPMAHEILNANPYAFLDDAPLEERRARAVALRRTDPDLAQGIGALSPEALAEVKAQAWPDIRDADELHDLLLTVRLLPVREAAPWQHLAGELMAAKRATVAWPGGEQTGGEGAGASEPQAGGEEAGADRVHAGREGAGSGEAGTGGAQAAGEGAGAGGAHASGEEAGAGGTHASGQRTGAGGAHAGGEEAGADRVQAGREGAGRGEAGTSGAQAAGEGAGAGGTHASGQRTGAGGAHAGGEEAEADRVQAGREGAGRGEAGTSGAQAAGEGAGAGGTHASGQRTGAGGAHAGGEEAGADRVRAGREGAGRGEAGTSGAQAAGEGTGAGGTQAGGEGARAGAAQDSGEEAAMAGVGGAPFYVAAERLSEARAMLGAFRMEPVVIEPGAGDQGAGGDAPASAALAEDALRRTVQGWMEITGPVTAAGLAARIGLAAESVDRGLRALEVSGAVLQGRFSPRTASDGPPEWCERRLLSRIHRLTLGRLRREIHPVSAADFLRFLLRWQHVQPGSQLHGRDGVHQVIRQLQGMELPAPAWEQHLLPARIAAYDPADLEHLCLAGVVTWGRLRRDTGAADDETEAARQRDAAPLPLRSAPGKARRTAPTRSAPLAFVIREELPHFLDPAGPDWRGLQGLSAAAQDVAAYLEAHGASFLADIARGTGHVMVRTERALWELVTRGQVTGDGIAGLRMLLTPELRRRVPRPGEATRPRARKGSAERAMPVGRWSLWRSGGGAETGTETLARQLLQRYGVVFRELLARESRCPPWRLLLQAWRRMEARGEIRGGRFVNGFVGEQYALPEAVEAVRDVRRMAPDTEPVLVSCTDPLNLVGVLTPGPRVPVHSNQFIAYLNGAPAEIGPLGNVLSRVQPATMTGVE